jgi:hypothetical protein
MRELRRKVLRSTRYGEDHDLTVTRERLNVEVRPLKDVLDMGGAARLPDLRLAEDPLELFDRYPSPQAFDGCGRRFSAKRSATNLATPTTTKTAPAKAAKRVTTADKPLNQGLS